jgi:DNA polymerase III alpha subunit
MARAWKEKRAFSENLPLAGKDELERMERELEKALPHFGESCFEEKLAGEMERLELAVSGHPLYLYRDRLKGLKVTKSIELPRCAGRFVRVIGWLVTRKRVRTKRGEFMCFLTLEDLHGLMEATLFPDAYRRYGHLLLSCGPFLAGGLVEEDSGFCTLTVARLGLP